MTTPTTATQIPFGTLDDPEAALHLLANQMLDTHVEFDTDTRAGRRANAAMTSAIFAVLDLRNLAHRDKIARRPWCGTTSSTLRTLSYRFDAYAEDADQRGSADRAVGYRRASELTLQLAVIASDRGR